MFILYLRRPRAVHCLMIVIYVFTDSSLWNKITRTPPRLSYFLRPMVYNGDHRTSFIDESAKAAAEADVFRHLRHRYSDIRSISRRPAGLQEGSFSRGREIASTHRPARTGNGPKKRMAVRD